MNVVDPDDPINGGPVRDGFYAKQLVLRGIDDALRQHVAKLFSVWLSQPRGSPEHAATGVSLAVKRYEHAIAAIEREL